MSLGVFARMLTLLVPLISRKSTSGTLTLKLAGSPGPVECGSAVVVVASEWQTMTDLVSHALAVPTLSQVSPVSSRRFSTRTGSSITFRRTPW
jgi:hypothetical protein